jgi:hypothetical protein
MTTYELRNKIDATCDLSTNDFMVRVICLDCRVSYGRVQYKVQPVNGFGSAWVDSQRTGNWKGATNND